MQGQEYMRGGDRIMRIKSVDPLSAGKVYGLVCAAIGLIGGIIAALFSLAFAGMAAQAGSSGGGGEMFAGMAAIGIFALILYPVLYGIGGFIFGLLGALFYNLVARIVGGLEITVE